MDRHTKTYSSYPARSTEAAEVVGESDQLLGSSLLGRLLRRREVELITTLSRSSLYRLIAQNKFPQPIQLSANRCAWRAADVDAWLRKRS